MPTEEWRPVAGHSMYRVSSEGRVMSLHFRRERILRGGIDIHGYRFVFVEGAQIRRVHRLVAEAFHGPCPPGLQVRHLDGDSLNNAARNLAYGTQSDNEQDKLRHGTNPHASRARCVNDHLFEETAKSYRGRRICRPCQRANEARYRERRALRANRTEDAA